MTSKQLWNWFTKHENDLKHCEPQLAAESLSEILAQVDTRLGVEVSDERKKRSLTITAGGDPDVFPMAKQLINEAPRTRGWSFHALKPARGFKFTINANGIDLDASELVFEPLTSADLPKKLGIRLFFPSSNREATSDNDMVWQILETGIGEEATCLISHLEVESGIVKQEDTIPIEDLANYIVWFFSNK